MNIASQEQRPVAAGAAAVPRPLGPVHRQHGRVPGRVRADRRLRAERVRLAGPGRGRPAGPAQLRAGVPHARGGRPAGPDVLRRARVAGVRPQPGAAVRVAGGRGLRGARARPAARRGRVRGVLLRGRRAAPVRRDRRRRSGTAATTGECLSGRGRTAPGRTRRRKVVVSTHLLPSPQPPAPPPAHGILVVFLGRTRHFDVNVFSGWSRIFFYYLFYLFRTQRDLPFYKI